MSRGHPHLNPLPSRERKLNHFAVMDRLMSFSIFPRRAPNASCCLREDRKNVGLGLKIGQKVVLPILVFIWMILPVVTAVQNNTDSDITFLEDHGFRTGLIAFGHLGYP